MEGVKIISAKPNAKQNAKQNAKPKVIKNKIENTCKSLHYLQVSLR